MARPALSFWSTRRDLVGSFFGQHWLAAWKDADPDIPILQQAKAEYAKLH